MFYEYFLSLILICIAILSFKNYKFDENTENVYYTPVVRKLETKYLTGSFFMLVGDWLQGPITYALYQLYGYDKYTIGVLFLAGFLSSCVGGFFLGKLVDIYGRKKGMLLYGLLYILSCLTKHFDNFTVLFFGRICGGLATSLLFSAFDSWLIGEHSKLKLDCDVLPMIFKKHSKMTSMTAIFSGLLAHFILSETITYDIYENVYFGGYTACFDVCVFFLAFGMYYIRKWDENYGVSSGDDIAITEAIIEIWKNSQIFYLFLVQGIFEGVMYVFIFMWTPSLSVDVPHGIVFGSLMASVYIGATISNNFSNPLEISLIIGSISFFMVNLAFNDELRVLFFCMFEFSCGIYLPSISSLKSRIVPENSRCLMYNIFRIPTNLIVCVTLLVDIDINFSFILSSISLIVAYRVSKLIK